MNVITTPQPTRGQLLTQLPLQDFAVPTFPRSMTRFEWRQAGYHVKQRQEPIYKAWSQEARWYKGEWHAGLVNIYTKDACETVEQYKAAKAEREASEAASKAEWAYLDGLGVVKAAARRIYVHLFEKAKAANTDTVITNNDELRAACKIRRNDLKAHRDELVQHGFIRHKLTVGRQSKITLLRISTTVSLVGA
jgi:intergrase/recombinase